MSGLTKELFSCYLCSLLTEEMCPCRMHVCWQVNIVAQYQTPGLGGDGRGSVSSVPTFIHALRFTHYIAHRQRANISSLVEATISAR